VSRIHRRGFLAGVGGAAVALPFLESVVFTGSRAHAGDSNPVYSLFFKHNNGVAQAEFGEPERFWPSELGRLDRDTMLGRDADRAVSELADYADKLLLVRGTRFGWYAESCGHAEGSVQSLTAGRPYLSEGGGPARLSNHESIDWRIGQLNPKGVTPLYLMSGYDDGSYFAGPSFRGPGEPRASRNNPLEVYTSLMLPMEGESSEVALRIAQRRASVNDLVKAELDELRGNARLGSADKRRLDRHFESVRDFEVRMACSIGGLDVGRMSEVAETAAEESNRIVVAQLMMDLAVLVFSCNVNRSVLLQMTHGASDGTRYMIDGVVQDNFHRISHRIRGDGSLEECIAELGSEEACRIDGADVVHHKIDREMAKVFRYFIERASATEAANGGPLIDQCIAAWTNEVSGGPSHGVENVPWVIAGSGGGFLRQGEYIDAGGVTHNKLLNTILSAHGFRNDDGGYYDRFGDASLERGVIDGMIAG
jgi:hypothetical protein